MALGAALASVGSSLFGASLSYGGNLATSAINSSRAWKYTQRAMKLQDELNRNYYQWSGENGPTFNRTGMERAGFNPLLAIGQGTASGASYSGASINSDSDNGSQAVASAMDALRLKNETKLRKSQVSLNKTQEDLNTQQTYKTLAEEISARAHSAVEEATEQKILNDIYWSNETNRELIKKIQAETKFTNERARGFSASSSESSSTDVNLGGNFGTFKGRNIGANVKGGHSSSKSSSKSW